LGDSVYRDNIIDDRTVEAEMKETGSHFFERQCSNCRWWLPISQQQLEENGRCQLYFKDKTRYEMCDDFWEDER
jgi:hypothetical protein